MKQYYDDLLRQIAELSADGSLGPDVAASAAAYSELPGELGPLLGYIADFYDAKEPGFEEVDQARDYFVQVIIVAYREAKRHDPECAAAFAKAFVEDFPGTKGTALLPRWVSLSNASRALKSVAFSGDLGPVWEHSSRLVLQVNEFLDGLIGMLIIAWRCGLAKPVNVRVLHNAYGSKIDEFSTLTGGDEGVFYLLLRLARPRLRNGLAHGSAWLDRDSGVVRYVAGREDKQVEEIETTEFMSLAKLGTDLAQAYVASLSAIVILESENVVVTSMLPEHLVRLWNFESHA